MLALSLNARVPTHVQLSTTHDAHGHVLTRPRMTSTDADIGYIFAQ